MSFRSVYKTSIQLQQSDNLKTDTSDSLTTKNDLPWITEKTKINIGGRTKGMTSNLPVPKDNYKGCLFAVRINNRQFGPYDHIETTPECNVNAPDQDPFKTVCKL